MIKSVLMLAVIFGFQNCQDDKNDRIDRKYQLVWEDDFNGAAGTAPDTTKWAYDLGIGPGNDGWGNQELQYYTDRPENASHHEGAQAAYAQNCYRGHWLAGHIGDE